MTGNDAVEMMLAGASLVGVGTACFDDPYAPVKIIGGISKYLSENSVNAIGDIIGKVVIH
jgi:dihydroorotate dehydrogenase (NAD+) catalytic subunit